jgi:hypothetical protein
MEQPSQAQLLLDPDQMRAIQWGLMECAAKPIFLHGADLPRGSHSMAFLRHGFVIGNKNRRGFPRRCIWIRKGEHRQRRTLLQSQKPQVMAADQMARLIALQSCLLQRAPAAYFAGMRMLARAAFMPPLSRRSLKYPLSRIWPICLPAAFLRRIAIHDSHAFLLVAQNAINPHIPG